jgi:FkbM family methyltransferase
VSRHRHIWTSSGGCQIKAIRRYVSLAIRERLFRRWGIPFSRYGVDPGIVKFLSAAGPISYIDVGASSGWVAEAIDRHYGIKRGILIEPQPARCAELRQRFADPRFSVHLCAVAQEAGTREMEVLQWDYSSSLLPVKRDLANVSEVIDLKVRENIECRVDTLDSVMVEAQWKENVDLLKIDVQGAELLALRGAEQTLPRVRMIYTEVSFTPLYEGSCVFQEIYDFLRAHGFRLLSLREGFRGKDEELLQGDALFGR